MSLSTLFSRLIGDLPLTGHKVPLTKKKFAELFKAHPSFVDYFPIVDYTPESKTFLMDDGISRGVVFRAIPADTDGRSDDTLHATLERIDSALRQLQRNDEFPYVCQIFLEDREPENIADLIEASLPELLASTEYTQVWLEQMSEHFELMRSPHGIFSDERVASSGSDQKGWRAIDRMVHVCLYRKASEKAWTMRQRYTPEEQLNKAVKSFVFSLQNAGINMRCYDDNDLRNWLLPWLSPTVSGYDSPQAFLKDNPLPRESIAGWDLGEQIVHLSPTPIPDRDEETDRGAIKLGDTYMRYVTLQGIEQPPAVGTFTQDPAMADVTDKANACIFDRMPSETIMVCTLVPRQQAEVDTHLDTMHISATKSASEWAADAENQVVDAKTNRRHHAEIFQVQIGYFLRADSLGELDDKRINAQTVIAGTGLRPISPEHDLLADDAVIRNLPFVYDWQHDKTFSLRSKMAYTAHIAAVLPFFGRGLGGTLGYIMYRRDGQVYSINPFKDKVRVAHKVLFGPSGSGKSATFICQTAETMAMERPRQIIIEKGNSFDLLMHFYGQHGIRVARHQFSMQKSPSFPPFVETANALAELRGEVTTDEEDDDEQRSYFGEMLNIAQLMITGGQAKAVEEFSQSKRAYLQTAMINALEAAEERGDPHTRPSDIVSALRALCDDEKLPDIKTELRHMADAMSLWESGTRGLIFNTHGQAFNDDDDVTHIDLGLLTAEGNQDMLQVAILAIVYNISALGERHQYSGRHCDVLVDEGHYLARNALAAQSLTTGVKVWRKLDTWLTIATQNMADFNEDAKMILEQAEFWFLLSMSLSELNKLNAFKVLTDEQKSLILQTRKEPPNFVEGVILCESHAPALVRFVPPALAFALAKTDPAEKRERRKLMVDLGVSELEAVRVVAEQINRERRQFARGLDNSAPNSTERDEGTAEFEPAPSSARPETAQARKDPILTVSSTSL